VIEGHIFNKYIICNKLIKLVNKIIYILSKLSTQSLKYKFLIIFIVFDVLNLLLAR
jgi:hypothetical protein